MKKQLELTQIHKREAKKEFFFGKEELETVNPCHKTQAQAATIQCVIAKNYHTQRENEVSALSKDDTQDTAAMRFFQKEPILV